MAKSKITDTKKNEAEEQIIEERTPISYDTREYTVQTIVEMYKCDEWIVPRYQREFVWNEEKQSKFIESILLDLPIPYLYLADEPDTGKLEILDGSQRIRTLFAFLNNKLKLKSLLKLEKLNGFYYDDLLETRKRRFGRKTLRSIELTETVYKASWLVRKDLFDRINTKPYDLTPMQIRKGLVEKKFYNFLNDNSKSALFKKLAPISETKRKNEDGAEMVLRYFAYSNNYNRFVHSVIEFVDEYLYEKLKNYNIPELQKDFTEMLNFVEKYFTAGFKKKTNHNSTPTVRYEAIAVGVRLALNIEPKLIPKPVVNWIDSQEFINHTRSDAANNRLKVIARIEYVRDKLLEK
jgi:hypothetical protein